MKAIMGSINGSVQYPIDLVLILVHPFHIEFLPRPFLPFVSANYINIVDEQYDSDWQPLSSTNTTNLWNKFKME